MEAPFPPDATSGLKIRIIPLLAIHQPPYHLVCSSDVPDFYHLVRSSGGKDNPPPPPLPPPSLRLLLPPSLH
jgi:hypothetical protein